MCENRQSLSWNPLFIALLHYLNSTFLIHFRSHNLSLMQESFDTQIASETDDNDDDENDPDMIYRDNSQ
jgi:hypothetical protein